MGTSGAYSGSGGKDGKAIRDAISDSLDPASGMSGTRPALDPSAIQQAINLIRPRPWGGGGGDGPGGGGGGGGRASGGSSGGRSSGGPRRSVAGSARSAGRAAAAAYAYKAGDVAGLQKLGLDYAELKALGDQFEVLRRIVDMACSTPESTIEDHEQRLVAADIAEWVIGQEDDGYVPPPEEIVRQTIALIVAEVILSESGQVLNSSNQARLAESDIRDAAEALAQRATLSVSGATDIEITRAVEAGIETLRDITGGKLS